MFAVDLQGRAFSCLGAGNVSSRGLQRALPGGAETDYNRRGVKYEQIKLERRISAGVFDLVCVRRIIINLYYVGFLFFFFL